MQKQGSISIKCEKCACTSQHPEKSSNVMSHQWYGLALFEYPGIWDSPV